MTAPKSSVPEPNPSAGTPRTTGRGHLTSYGVGRVCALPDCATRLSRYNSTVLCSVHAQAERLSRR